MIDENIRSHLFFSPIKNFPQDFSEREKTALTDAYTEMIGKRVIPAYKKLYEFMATEYLEAGRESSAFGAFPDGSEYYKHAIEVYTTTKMSADEIHELGLREVARIRNEMEMVMEQVEFKGSLKDFFKFIRNSKSLMPFGRAEEVISNFNSIYEKIKPQVDQLFELQPKTAFEIKRVEAFREASAAAHYNSGSLDGTRPGVSMSPFLMSHSSMYILTKLCFYTKPFPGIIFKYPYSKKIKICQILEKTSSKVHFRRVGHFTPSRWEKNWGYTRILTSILEC